MRAQHGEMVGRRLGVGRADADIDDGDAAAAVAAQQVVGRHLEAVPRRGQHGGFGHRRVVAPPHDGAARQHELGVGAVGLGQLLHRPGQEMIDIALVVGGQDPWLDGAPVGARVVDQALQRVVDPSASNRASGRAPRSCDTQVPSAISSPTLASTGVGKWRASSDTERSPWMNSSPASVTKG